MELETKIVELILSRVNELKKSRIKQVPCTSNRASSMGHECVRFLTYQRVAWNQAAMHDVGLQNIFDEGNLHETDVRKTLMDAGLEIGGGQNAFEVRDLKLTGHIDGFLFIDPKDIGLTEGKKLRVPFEIKSVHPNFFNSLTTWDSVRNHKKHHIRSYATQIQLYLLENEEEIGVFIFKNKSTGELRIIPATLDMDLCDGVYTKAKRINEHVAMYDKAKSDEQREAAMPERIDYDASICGGCRFSHLCQPDVALKQVEIVNDEELAFNLTRWNELKPLVKEYDDLDNTIKTKIEGKTAMVGDFYVSGKWVEYKATPEKLTPAKPARKTWFKKIERVETKGGIINAEQ